MEQLGDKILHFQLAGERVFLSTPVSPMANLYLPQVTLLAQVKLRLGYILSRQALLTLG